MAIDWSALVVGITVDVFGTPGIYTPMTPITDAPDQPVLTWNGDPITVAGMPYACTGVFDEAFMEVDPSGSGPFASTERADFGSIGGITEVRPVYGVQLSAMQSEPTQSDQVVICGTTYVVKEVQPDGHGWALLLLNLAP